MGQIKENTDSMPPPVALVGNKLDLAEKRAVAISRGTKFSHDVGAATFIEASAKDGDSVQDAFLELSRVILYKQETARKSQEKPRGMRLKSNANGNSSGCC